MKTVLKRTSFWLCILCISLASSFNTGFAKGDQDAPGYLEIFGKVKSADKIPHNMMVMVFRNGEKIAENMLTDNGKFDFQLELNAIYDLQFSGDIMISKTIEVNTSIADPSNLGCEYEYKFNVNLIGGYEAEDASVLKQPIVKIAYNKEYDGFDYDRENSKQFKNEKVLSYGEGIF